MVNSIHHQAVERVAPGLRASAFADDGVIEALEGFSGLVLAVQWHPECLPVEMASKGLFLGSLRRPLRLLLQREGAATERVCSWTAIRSEASSSSSLRSFFSTTWFPRAQVQGWVNWTRAILLGPLLWHRRLGASGAALLRRECTGRVAPATNSGRKFIGR